MDREVKKVPPNAYQPHVLVAEDDPVIRQMFSTFLHSRGFTVTEAADGVETLNNATGKDIILLDVMMPEMDGWAVAEHLKDQQPETPILMVTALGELPQRLHGFSLGVDDYLVKPVDLHELEARIRAIMRRAGIHETVIHGPLVLDPVTRTVLLNAVAVDLTPLEFDLLLLLARKPEKIWSRADLLNIVWGDDYFGTDRTVDVRIAGLRKKLSENSSREFIETVRSRGYRFKEQPRSSESD